MPEDGNLRRLIYKSETFKETIQLNKVRKMVTVYFYWIRKVNMYTNKFKKRIFLPLDCCPAKSYINRLRFWQFTSKLPQRSNHNFQNRYYGYLKIRHT